MEFIILGVYLMLPVTGILLAVTPYLMKKNECFAVTIPESAHRDPYVVKQKRKYFIVVIVLTLLSSLSVFLLYGLSFQMEAFAAYIAAFFIICLVSYSLMLHFRRKIRMYKAEKQWLTTKQESVAFTTDTDIPKALHPRWNLVYLPIIIVTLYLGIAGYHLIPDSILMQVDFYGNPTRSIEKSPLVVAFPILIQGFLALCFFFAHWSILRSKPSIDPQSPATSSFAYGLFARAQSIYLFISGILLTASFITMPFSFMGFITITQAAAPVIIVAFFSIIGAFVISFVYGQSGSRVFRKMKESTVLLADNDKYWKLGVFYWNPEDASLFIPARFGIGWTCNFARPAVWLFTFFLLLITVIFVVIIMTLF